MKTTSMVPCTLVAILLPLTVDMAAEPASTASPEEPAPVSPADALWPSPELLEFQLREAARLRAEEYGLDDAQRAQLEDALLARWPRFFRDNEDELRPLLTQLVEARTAPEPPEAERVAQWARRALPMWERIEAEIARSDKDIEQLLNPQQREAFRHDREQMHKRLRAVRQTLSKWKQGAFEPGSAWDEPPPPEPSPPTPDRAPAPPEDQVEAELDAWTRHVQDFCNTYQLDRTQRETAYSILRELQERARAHRDRHRDEIDRMERVIAGPEPVEQQELMAKLQRLYGPVDDMFRELDRRLVAIPTSAQARRVQAAAAAASQPASQPGPTAP